MGTRIPGPRPTLNTYDMKDVIERLRDSKAKYASEEYNQGFACGQEWAKDKAEAIDLMNLFRAFDRAQRDWDNIVCGTIRYSPAETLFFLIKPEHIGDRDESTGFWEAIFGAGESPGEYGARGFAEGAIQVWIEVEHQL
jgi:hypothetical protein